MGVERSGEENPREGSTEGEGTSRSTLGIAEEEKRKKEKYMHIHGDLPELRINTRLQIVRVIKYRMM